MKQNQCQSWIVEQIQASAESDNRSAARICKTARRELRHTFFSIAGKDLGLLPSPRWMVGHGANGQMHD
jgi:hypothetical protein